jgi:hypothetical protein
MVPLVMSCLFFIVGILLIVGTLMKWKILTDPPEALSDWYSYSWIKKNWGKKYLIPINYGIGAIFLAISIFSFIQLLTK